MPAGRLCALTLLGGFLLSATPAAAAEEGERAFFETVQNVSRELVDASLATRGPCYPETYAPANLVPCVTAVDDEAKALARAAQVLAEQAPPPPLQLPFSDYQAALAREAEATAAVASALRSDDREAARDRYFEAINASIAADDPLSVIRQAAPEEDFLGRSENLTLLSLLAGAAGVVAVAAAGVGLLSGSREASSTQAPPSAPPRPAEVVATRNLPADASATEVAAAGVQALMRIAVAYETAATRRSASPYRLAALAGAFSLAAAGLNRL